MKIDYEYTGISIITFCNSQQGSSSFRTSFNCIVDNTEYTFQIEFNAFEISRIEIRSNFGKSQMILLSIIQKVMEFDLILSGYFLEIQDIFLEDSITMESGNFLKKKLPDSYYTHLDYSSPRLRLIYYCKEFVQNFGNCFKQWLELDKQIFFQFKVFMFATCRNKPTVDLSNAILVQIFEPLYSICFDEKIEKTITWRKKFLHLYEILTPGRDNPSKSNKCINNAISYIEKYKDLPEKNSLYLKLTALFQRYGEIYFQKENKESKLSSTITDLVNIRNKIFHADNKNLVIQSDSFYYKFNMKLYLLYRNVILSRIGLQNQIADLTKVIFELDEMS